MKNNYYIADFFLLLVTLSLLFYSSDPVFHIDSARYIKQSFMDPPIYSTVIIVMEYIFGTLNSVVIFQTLFIFFGIVFFTRNVTKYFNLSLQVKIIIYFFLFLPILQFYRNLLTEPLGYAFSLFFITFIIKLIFNFKYQNLIGCTLFSAVLLLLRNQFIFIYPLLIFIYIGILILNKPNKIFNYLLLSFISLLFIQNSLNFLNSYVKKDIIKLDIKVKESSGPYFFTYFDAIYISSKDDLDVFEDENLKEVLLNIFIEMDNRKSLVKHYDGRGHFGLSLKEISDYSSTPLENFAVEKKTSVKNLKKEISLKLIKKNFGRYVKHLFKKAYDSTWLFMFLPFFIILGSITGFLKYKSRFSLIILTVSMFSFANHALIYLFGRVQPRYLIYSDFILLIFIFITFIILSRKKTLNSLI